MQFKKNEKLPSDVGNFFFIHILQLKEIIIYSELYLMMKRNIIIE